MKRAGLLDPSGWLVGRTTPDPAPFGQRTPCRRYSHTVRMIKYKGARGFSKGTHQPQYLSGNTLPLNGELPEDSSLLKPSLGNLFPAFNSLNF